MCMTPKMPDAPAAPIIPESVKRVAKDQRRTVADNTSQAAAKAGATNNTGGGLVSPAATAKKSLLGV